MLDQSPLISRDKDILGGIPVFAGTRVPAKTLLEYLQKRYSLDEFLDDFPTVTRRQAQELLADLQNQLMASA
jgi:uncharacterized protein (DUF433 family)